MALTAPVLVLDTTHTFYPGLHTGLWLPDSQQYVDFSVPLNASQTPARSEHIIPMLAAGLAQAGVAPQTLGAIAVNSGPGSFTGLRIGLTVARIMAQTLPQELSLLALSGFQWAILGTALELENNSTVSFDALRNRAYQATVCAETLAYVVAPHVVLVAEPPPPIDFCWARVMKNLPKALQYGLCTAWEQCQPLYIQPPAITLKKSLV